MAHDETAVCRCTSDHRPPVLEYQAHHVFPKYLGGPDNGELVFLCSTGHDNVHELLRLMLRVGRSLTDYELQAFEDRPVSRYAAMLAREAFARWQGTLP